MIAGVFDRIEHCGIRRRPVAQQRCAVTDSQRSARNLFLDCKMARKQIRRTGRLQPCEHASSALGAEWASCPDDRWGLTGAGAVEPRLDVRQRRAAGDQYSREEG